MVVSIACLARFKFHAVTCGLRWFIEISLNLIVIPGKSSIDGPVNFQVANITTVVPTAAVLLAND